MTRLTLSLHMAQKFHAGLKTQTRRVSPPRFKVGDVVAIAEPCTVLMHGVIGDEISYAKQTAIAENAQ